MTEDKKSTKEWEELEKIVTEIQQQLASDATVEHNRKMIGKSGITRKLDVSVSTKIGLAPILVVFDCKHHRKPVTLKDVAAFSVQVEDVSANLGVMVSSSGYDSGAIAIAKQKNIVLQTYRKAGDTDWKELLGDKAWVAIFEHSLRDPMVLASLSTHPNQLVRIDLGTILFDENGKKCNSILNSFWESWKTNGEKIGYLRAGAIFSNSFIQIFDGKLIQIHSVEVITEVVTKQYLINFNFAKGVVLQDEHKEKIKYRTLETEVIDWKEAIRNQSGKELSADEYEKIRQHPKTMNISLSEDKRYFYAAITEISADY